MERSTRRARGFGPIKYLITGGAGFIGSNLASRLSIEESEVHTLDWVSEDRVPHRLIGDTAYHRMDITGADAYEFVRTGGFHVVYHFAAMSSVAECNIYPRQCMDVNLNGTVNMYQAAVLGGVKRFIFASTGAVYGHVPHGAASEENTPVQPTSAYGVSKAAAEMYLDSHRSRYTESLALRIGNVFGAGSKSVVDVFLLNAKARDRVVIQGDGSVQRDFIHVTDVIDMVEALTNSAWREQANRINVSTGKGVSVRALANFVQKLYPDVRLDGADPRKGDPVRSVLDPTKRESWIQTPPRYGLGNYMKGVHPTPF